MDNLFNDIGLDNVDINTNKKSRFPSNDMILVEKDEEIEEETRYTEDGRPTDKYSIVYKTHYPNPDTTGNGVDTTPEIGSREDIGSIEKPHFVESSKWAKSLINHTYDSLTEIRSKFKMIMSCFYYNNTTDIDNDLLNTAETIYKNLVNSEVRSSNAKNYDSKSRYSFFNCDIKTFGLLYMNFINTLVDLDFSNTNLTLTP